MAYMNSFVDPLQNRIAADASEGVSTIHYGDTKPVYGDVSPTDKSNEYDMNGDKIYDANSLEKGEHGTYVDSHFDDQDRKGAAAALRTSTWINTFFLITTDILGPQNAPYSISTLGYVPGAILYFVFGMAAMYSGLVLQRLYLALDSEERPVRTYSDIGLRVFEHYGPYWAKGFRAILAFFQILQQLFSVAILILGNASGLNEIVGVDSPFGNPICFLALSAGFMGAGMVLGQIKTFRNLSLFANTCVWINLFICFGTVGIAATSTPMWGDGVNDVSSPGGLFSILGPSGTGVLQPYAPVAHNITTDYDFTIPVTGIMNMCYAYAGANMFVEFMAEMKDPREFFKAQLCAQTLIIGCYMLFGLLMYNYQGQYVANPANQGIRPYGWQTAFNVLSLYTAVIAAVMYGSVGMKVFYVSVLQDNFNAPALSTRKGSWIWRLLVVVFWGIAFVLAEAIPIFGDLVSITSAACVLQYTYTFPALMQLAFECQKDATWGEMFRRKWWLKSIDLTLFLASLGVMGIGLYSSGTVLMQDIQSGTTVPFSCTYS